MQVLCPVCKEILIKEDNRYVCPKHHCFDIAKEGYLNLNLKNSNHSGDESEMIKARTAFLNQGYYDFLRIKINDIIKSLTINNLVDLACGEGYYTSYFEVNDKLGIDLSKTALKYASKHDKSTTYILKNIFDLPLANESVDLALTIFAPISREIIRIIKKGGYFLLVRPNVQHLYELKAIVYDSVYLNEVVDNTIPGFKLIHEYKLKNKVLLKNADLINLFKMTPYYHKTSKNDYEKLFNIVEREITFSFIIDLYQKS